MLRQPIGSIGWHVVRLAAVLWLVGAGRLTAQEPPVATYVELVRADQPAVYWRFDADDLSTTIPATPPLAGHSIGEVIVASAGPRPAAFPLFSESNQCLALGQRGYVRVPDPGPASILDFDRGDAITMEAWVNPLPFDEGQQIYILGKGRTNLPGTARDNQNYALRLRLMQGSARISFLFRTAGQSGQFHRWNSSEGFLPGTGWHHVAVSFVFGDGQSMRGYLDGREVPGDWDMGGPTDEPPVVDDDELWIGSSLGGNTGNSFEGRLDEIAVYRHVVPREHLQRRYEARIAASDVTDWSRWPTDHVDVQLFDNIADRTWEMQVQEPFVVYAEPLFCLLDTPHRYSAAGTIGDRPNPYLLRAQSRLQLPAGKYRLLLRAKSAARILLDGQVVAQTSFMNRNASGHEPVPDLVPPLVDDMHLCPPSFQETVCEVEWDGAEHGFRLETIVGGKGLRPELGETIVAWQPADDPGAPFVILGPGPERLVLSEREWPRLEFESRQRLHGLQQHLRSEAAAGNLAYWSKRHQQARQFAEQHAGFAGPLPDNIAPEQAVDYWIEQPYREATGPAPSLLDDHAFLRRVYLDLVGVVPTSDEVRRFLSDPGADRRQRLIDRLLDDPRWADPWVAYWQDVLAENPGILKPELNNTGPFRWWLYESFLDNKPLDRFATELALMQGGKFEGGPAGFALASQNDAPMAAKAHILAQAFLGLEMKCARCHDAPYHPFQQKQLFELAAMLERKPLELPVTSTVPRLPGGRQPAVEITLKPGDSIAPAWPFEEWSDADVSQLLRDPEDSRERFAALLTSPRNPRFARVMVNRVWRRYLGWGLVDPVDDWNGAEPSHPELLDFLARELLLHGYDVKHVSRLILKSRVYQRSALDAPPGHGPRQAPLPRRMSAEQVVDSLFAAAGKPFQAEALTMDPEGRRPYDSFLNLGVPQRAWQFTSLSNERDRPALALPVSQSIVDLMLAFGWRDSRPHPVSHREVETTVLQPLALANGIAAHRALRLSEDSQITQLCLQELPLDALIEELFLRTLTRQPTADERVVFTGLLETGYATRRKLDVPPAPPDEPRRRTAVSWSNHLSPEASEIKIELERLAREGEPPTRRLDDDWRMRAEDVLWALVNSPEFVFIP
jgi:hypothetical protein